MKGIARRFLPVPARRRLTSWWGRARRGRVSFGDLRRLSPLSRDFGFDRGLPVDRYYIEGFLELSKEAIRGRVLEVGTAMYTRRFGGGRVASCEVLHVSERKPDVTVIGDLTDTGLELEEASFDCVILTQVLQFIFDAPAALRTVYRLLRPGGELLLSVAGISPASRYDVAHWGEYWRFTSSSVATSSRRPRSCSACRPTSSSRRSSTTGIRTTRSSSPLAYGSRRERAERGGAMAPAREAATSGPTDPLPADLSGSE
jgi:hypothetical protein